MHPHRNQLLNMVRGISHSAIYKYEYKQGRLFIEYNVCSILYSIFNILNIELKFVYLTNRSEVRPHCHTVSPSLRSHTHTHKHISNICDTHSYDGLSIGQNKQTVLILYPCCFPVN